MPNKLTWLTLGLTLGLTLAALAVSACFVGCNGASEIAREYVGKDGPDKGFSYAKLTRGNHVRKYGLFGKEALLVRIATVTPASL